MRVGRPFTWRGKHFKAGADFDIELLQDWQKPTYVRLFALSERPAPRKKKKQKIEDDGVVNLDPKPIVINRKKDDGG